MLPTPLLSLVASALLVNDVADKFRLVCQHWNKSVLFVHKLVFGKNPANVAAAQGSLLGFLLSVVRTLVMPYRAPYTIYASIIDLVAPGLRHLEFGPACFGCVDLMLTRLESLRCAGSSVCADTLPYTLTRLSLTCDAAYFLRGCPTRLFEQVKRLDVLEVPDWQCPHNVLKHVTKFTNLQAFTLVLVFHISFDAPVLTEDQCTTLDLLAAILLYVKSVVIEFVCEDYECWNRDRKKTVTYTYKAGDKAKDLETASFSLYQVLAPLLRPG